MGLERARQLGTESSRRPITARVTIVLFVEGVFAEQGFQ